jgi:hypothetical protein
VLEFADDHASLSAHADTMLELDGLPVGAGATIDLYFGDELRLSSPDLPEPLVLRVARFA